MLARFILFMCFILIDLDALPSTYETLQTASDTFAKEIAQFPTQTNLMKQFATTSQKQMLIAEMAEGAHPQIHQKVMELIKGFLYYKRSLGSQLEKKLYANMTPEAFVDRLLKKRPLMFMTYDDEYLLRNGAEGSGGFDTIGTDQEKPPLILEDYLSYDEMAISAMVGVSVPTYFINDGARHNRAVKGEEGTYQPLGVYTGIVGCRFERPGLMEWAHMVITPDQNRPENGYGSQNTKQGLLALWAQFYQQGDPARPFFPSFEEAKKDTSGRYIAMDKDHFFNKAVYKQRMRMSVEPFLVDANLRAQQKGVQAFVYAAPTGLGVWLLHPIQKQLLFEVYNEVLNSRDLSHISDIQIEWLSEDQLKAIKPLLETKNQRIAFHFTKRPPAALLTGSDKDKLLVASYAWDGNAFPGNEYWAGMLDASGDPAAASCSGIPELQNPYINSKISGHNLFLVE